RTSNADACQNVLAFAERELHLRHDVPVCFRAGFQISIGESFDHRRPDAAEAAIMHKRFSDCRMDEDSLWRFLRADWQFCAALHLQKTEAGQPLAKGGKGCECRYTGSELLR